MRGRARILKKPFEACGNFEYIQEAFIDFWELNPFATEE